MSDYCRYNECDEVYHGDDGLEIYPMGERSFCVKNYLYIRDDFKLYVLDYAYTRHYKLGLVAYNDYFLWHRYSIIGFSF